MKKILPLAFALVVFTSVQSAEDLYGVVSVADGDTVTLKANDIAHKIRLAEIDTPERDQPYGLGTTPPPKPQNRSPTFYIHTSLLVG